MKNKIQIQWATKTPQAHIEDLVQNWEALPKKAKPPAGSVHNAPNDQPGWVQSLCFMGTVFENCDHYAVIPLSDGTDPSVPYVKIVSWIDDIADHPADKLYANEFTFYPIQPDPKLGDPDPKTWPLNTRCDVKHYTGPGRPINAPDGWTTHPWSEFVAPADQFVKHGKWVSDRQYSDHKTVRTSKGWREWGPDGKVPEQRPLGRYIKPKGTRTYYLRDTARANGTAVGTDELALETTAGAGEIVSESTSGGTQENSFFYTTPSGEPDSAAWPLGTYRVQFNATTIGTNLIFGVDTFGANPGNVRRENSGLTSNLETNSIGNVHAAPAGLKLSSTTLSWTAGNASDRWAFLVEQESFAAHGNETLALTCDSDCWTDGPWAAAGGGVTVAPATASATASAISPAVIQSSLSIAPANAQGVASAVDPAVVLGSLTINPAAGLMTASAVDPAVVQGSISIAPGSAQALAAAVDPTVVQGSVSLTPGVASATASASGPTVIIGGGGVTVTPAAAVATASAIDPAVVQGSVSIAPAKAQGVASAVNPAVVLGSLNINPAAGLTTASAADPTVNISGGGVTVTPGAASSTASAIDPAVVLGSLSINPAAAIATAAAQDPAVVLGSLTLAPGLAAMIAQAGGPNVVQGSLLVSPEAARSSAAAVDPIVTIGPGATASAPGSADLTISGSDATLAQLDAGSADLTISGGSAALEVE